MCASVSVQLWTLYTPQATDGRRQTADGRRQTADGRRQTAHAPVVLYPRVADVAPPVHTTSPVDARKRVNEVCACLSSARKMRDSVVQWEVSLVAVQN